MKKLTLAAILSLAVAAVWTTPSPAWTFGLIVHHGCCGCGCHGCGFNICCRPYNAFTPVCCGTLCCDGCCPINMGGGCGPAMAGPCGPCDGGACGAPGLGALPAVGSLPSTDCAPIASSMPTASPSNGMNPAVPSAAYATSFYPGYVYGMQPPAAAAAYNVPAYWNAK